MKCTQMCDQGRRCTCSDTDPARELIQEVVNWVVLIAVLVLAPAAIGFFVGIAWVWL